QAAAETAQCVAVTGVADQRDAAPGVGVHFDAGERVQVEVLGVGQVREQTGDLPARSRAGLGQEPFLRGRVRVPVVGPVGGEHEEGGCLVTAGGDHAAGLVVHQPGAGGGGRSGKGGHVREVGERVVVAEETHVLLLGPEGQAAHVRVDAV